MNKRNISILSTLILFVIAITGGVSAQDDSITLSMTAWDIATIPYWEAVIDAYEAENPNVTVELREISSAEYQDVLNIQLSGGDDTDIITVKDIPGYNAMLSRGQIIPLDSYIEEAGIDLSIYSGAADELVWEDQIYALPFRSDIWVLYYNKAIFDAAGVDYPSNDMTWAEFDEVARQLTSGSGADKIYGAHFHTWRSVVQLGTVQAGDPIINDDYSFMMPMYDMVTSMQADSIIMDYGELRAGSIHYSGPFENGQVGLLPMGSWYIGSLIQGQSDGDFDFDWGVASYPHPEGVEAGTTAGTLTSLAINANSSQQEAAWDFIQFYTGPEGAEVLAESTLPAIRTPEVLDVFVQADGMPEGTADALQTSTVRLELPMHPLVASVEQILNEEHELIMTRSNSVEDGIAEINRRIGELE